MCRAAARSQETQISFDATALVAIGKKFSKLLVIIEIVISYAFVAINGEVIRDADCMDIFIKRLCEQSPNISIKIFGLLGVTPELIVKN